MAETYSYPPAEHYVFPTTPAEQAFDDLHYYKTGDEYRAYVAGVLKKVYSPTPCMKSMERYARLASHLVTTTDPERPRAMNFDFYSGALVATHINTAPAADHLRKRLLEHDFLIGFDNNPNREALEDGIRDWFDTWVSDEEENWYNFLEGQGEPFQVAALSLSERFVEGRANADERQVDFMVGFCHASNLIWQRSKLVLPPYMV